jgi:hypothetical protein
VLLGGAGAVRDGAGHFLIADLGLRNGDLECGVVRVCGRAWFFSFRGSGRCARWVLV